MNVNLNIGGFIGAAVGLGLGGLFFYLIYNPEDIAGRRPYRLIIFALIGCALGGNFLWAKLFPPKRSNSYSTGSKS